MIFSQHDLRGKVTDEDGNSLPDATAILMSRADSSMVSFAISNDDGNFNLQGVLQSEYLIQLSFVSYTDIKQGLLINWSQKVIDLGEFSLLPSSEILREVKIEADHIPMGIRGDTISYNAAAFSTKPGATVEDLLKKLPGIEVARDGSIKAQGEEVDKVLVDGKEFFGNDPKIATQNLDAEAIDKVQVYDKKSEVAEFTGVDDGNEEKAIDLKLKDEYKNGEFGNIEAGIGTESRYKAKLNYNRFGPSMQASLIASNNNINEQAFSFNDYISFMGGFSDAMSASDGIMNFTGGFGRGLVPRGINNNTATGLNFNYDFSKKLELVSNYFFLQSKKDLVENSIGRQFSLDRTYTSVDSSLSDEKNINHRVNTKLKYKPSPFLQLIVDNNFSGVLADGLNQRSTAFSSGSDRTLTRANALLNDDQWGYEGKFQLRKKYGKKGRNWVSSLGGSTTKFDEENEISNQYNFNSLSTLIKQDQVYQNHRKSLNLRTTFTEPIASKRYLSLSYEFHRENEQPEKEFFDIVDSERLYNGELSSIYDKNLKYHRGGLAFKNNGKKTKLTLGVKAQKTDLSGKINDGVMSISGNYFHWLPSLSLDYEMSSSRSLNLDYTTSVKAPSLSQLMPLPDNADPNLFILGNPSLIPEYSHSARVGYNMFDQFNFTNLFTSINLNYTKNRIVNEININEDFTRVIRPVNTDNFISLNGFASFSRPFRPLGIKYRLSTYFGINKYESFINTTNSKVDERQLNLRLTLENRVKEHVDIATGVRWSYSTRSYAINEDFDQQYYNYDLFIDGDWYMTPSFTLSMSFDYKTYSQESFSEPQSFSLLNAQIRKDLGGDKLSLVVSVFDLLDENVGVERNGGLNSIHEIGYNTLGRYFMATMKYKLGKSKQNGISVDFD